jgi:hypothetical protein
MLNDNIEHEVINDKTYRTFKGWKSWGFQIKKGEKSNYRHPMFGAMFSSDQVYNPIHRSKSVGKEENHWSKYDYDM